MMSHYTFPFSMWWTQSGFFFSLTEATVELSLDSPRDKRKQDVTAKPSVSASASASASASSLSAAASLTNPQSSALEEVHTHLNQEICYFITPKISRISYCIFFWLFQHLTRTFRNCLNCSNLQKQIPILLCKHGFDCSVEVLGDSRGMSNFPLSV